MRRSPYGPGRDGTIRLRAAVLRWQPDPSEVLTAAHCVDFVGVPGGIPLGDLRVVVGRTVLTSTQGQKRRAAAVDIHPRWDPVTPALCAGVYTRLSNRGWGTSSSRSPGAYR
jgi:hypothetical protein